MVTGGHEVEIDVHTCPNSRRITFVRAPAIGILDKQPTAGFEQRDDPRKNLVHIGQLNTCQKIKDTRWVKCTYMAQNKSTVDSVKELFWPWERIKDVTLDVCRIRGKLTALHQGPKYYRGKTPLLTVWVEV